jgi:RimJ/RimL family protein N-acetyltransferase
MLTEVSQDAHETLRPLFDGFPGLHGCLHAIFEGTMGKAWADDAKNPRVALLDLDFYFLAGDPSVLAAEEVVRGLDAPWSVATSSEGWEPLLRRVWGGRLATRTRVAFVSPREWDCERLRRFTDALPDGFLLKRIERADAERFSALADSLVYNFDSPDDFIERGVGFGIEHEGRYVSGCSSFAISSRSLEFEIQTHPDYRGRDLATATASAMILYCLDAGLEPCWDAHNEISAKLATKLGFVKPKPYTAYEVHE